MKDMAAYYAERDMEFTEARQRMARTPEGAELIDNPISKAPGIRMENVYIMAGVPKIMQAMMDAIAPTLKSGTKMISQAIDCPFGEGTIGAGLGQIQETHDQTMIGSYPRYDDGRYTTQIVVRARQQALVEAAILDVMSMLEELSED